MKADFGTPIPRLTEEEIGKDAVNAVRCAIAMGTEMDRVNKVCEERGLPTVSMRIGLHTGQVVGGTLGSKGTSEIYNNRGCGEYCLPAGELCQGSNVWKSDSCRIVVGELTKQYLDSSFIFEEIGEVSLKGRGQKVRAFCVLGQECGQNSEGGKT